MCIRTFPSAFILYFMSSDSWIILLMIKTLSLLSYCNNGVDLWVVHAQPCYKCTENFTRVSVLEWWQRSVLICRWQGSAELVVIIAGEGFWRLLEGRGGWKAFRVWWETKAHPCCRPYPHEVKVTYMKNQRRDYPRKAFQLFSESRCKTLQALAC